MKRCPKCNRTYPSGTQRFCTNDGEMLVVVDAPPVDTIPKTFADPDAPTKAISRELLPEVPTGFDPFKTTVGGSLPRSEQTIEARGRVTGDLTPPAAPPPAQPQSYSPPSQQVSGPISQQLGEVTAPSMPYPQKSPPPPEPFQPQPTSGSLPPTGSGPIAAPSGTPSAPLPSPQFTGTPQPQQVQSLTPPTPGKKSKVPLILGILAVLAVLGAAVLGAAYVFVVRPALQARRTILIPAELPRQNPIETPSAGTTPVQEKASPAENVLPPFTPPPNAAHFVNSNNNLDGKLADHYVDFSFYYPDNWQKDPKSGVAGANNFVEVHRSLPPNFTQESVAVSWYDSAGSLQDDQELFRSYVETKSSQFAQSIGEYRKVSEGPMRVGPYDVYEFRFEGVSQRTEKGQFKIWGRVIWLPPQDGGKNGVTLLMLATSLAPELKGVSDVGEKGELPMILESFRFGRSTAE